MSHRAAEDLELVERFRRGDRGAFDELMRAHEDRVFGICLRTLRDRELALDATQETFLRVFRKIDRFSGEAAFSTWLYRVAVNASLDLARRRRRRATEPLPAYDEPADPAGADAYEAAELRPAVEQAVAEVPVEFRVPIVLCDIEGLPLQEAATIIGVPVGTVKSRLFRGRRRLAETLGNLRPPAGRRSDDDA